MAGQILGSLLTSDIAYGGSLRVTELVTRLNNAVSRRVRLCDQVSGVVAREAWSDATTGYVDFTNIRVGPWVLYAIDHTETDQAVCISHRLATTSGSRP